MSNGGGAQAFLRTLWRIWPAPWAKNQSLGVSHQQVTWSDLCLRKIQVEGRGRKTRSEVPMVLQGCGRWGEATQAIKVMEVTELEEFIQSHNEGWEREELRAILYFRNEKLGPKSMVINSFKFEHFFSASKKNKVMIAKLAFIEIT